MFILLIILVSAPFIIEAEDKQNVVSQTNNTKNVKIAVIGAGIMGMSSALAIKESLPDADITIIADKFSPNTTSDGTGGLIYPYLPGNTTNDKVVRWMNPTFKLLSEGFFGPNSAKMGVGLLSAFFLFGPNETHVYPDFTDDLISYRLLTERELKLCSGRCKSGEFVNTFFAEGSQMLPFFLKKFKSMGGKTLLKTVQNLDELMGQYDIVVNCAGAWASKLVNDPLAYPTRGQLLRVYAPWIKHAIMTSKYYIIPNSDSVILGGTKAKNRWDTEVDPKDTEYILDGCTWMLPSLKYAPILKAWVGLRPSRNEVRLEREVMNKNGQQMHLIHNYGHGGAGITLFWGCALDVAQHVKDIIDGKPVSPSKQ